MTGEDWYQQKCVSWGRLQDRYIFWTVWNDKFHKQLQKQLERTCWREEFWQDLKKVLKYQPKGKWILRRPLLWWHYSVMGSIHSMPRYFNECWWRHKIDNFSVMSLPMLIQVPDKMVFPSSWFYFGPLVIFFCMNWQ
jgi:hypothetical protein